MREIERPALKFLLKFADPSSIVEGTHAHIRVNTHLTRAHIHAGGNWSYIASGVCGSCIFLNICLEENNGYKIAK